MKNLYHSGRKMNQISSACFKNISNINREWGIEVFTTWSESGFLLQSQIVYYCFVDFITKENLTSLVKSIPITQKNHNITLLMLTHYFVISL